MAPFLAIDLVFFGANILRIAEGGWVPLLVAGTIGLIIVTWLGGSRAAIARSERQGVPMVDLAAALAKHPPVAVDGLAVFLTQDIATAPSALLHNLKHNKTLHRANILLKVEPQQTPHVPLAKRLTLERIDERFSAATLRYGYMDPIDVPTDLARREGLLAAPGGTSFFVGRSAIRRAVKPSLPRWMAALYGFLHRNAADPTAYFSIPPNRVVELGSQFEL